MARDFSALSAPFQRRAGRATPGIRQRLGGLSRVLAAFSLGPLYYYYIDSKLQAFRFQSIPFILSLLNPYLLPPLSTLQRGQILDDGNMDIVLSRLSTQLLSPLTTDELLFREPPAFLSRYVTYISCILLSMMQWRALLISYMMNTSSPRRY